VWPPGIKTFVPASEQFISIYAWFDVALTLLTGAGYILELFDFRTRAAERKCLRLFAEAF
jgi:hypothetical protein